ncbi:helix-turn-helix transcriptional regulator [Actinosynnema sp. NPDC051121]
MGWRLRRNLGRKQLADMIGRSTSWLDKVESGERNVARIPVIELVADALAIDPSVLTDAPAAARAADRVDAAEVSAIRAALGRYPGLAAADTKPVGVACLARQADYIEHAWTSTHFTTVAQHLPKLLEAAQRVALAAPPAEQVDAYRVLIAAYRLASRCCSSSRATTSPGWQLTAPCTPPWRSTTPGRRRGPPAASPAP